MKLHNRILAQAAIKTRHQVKAGWHIRAVVNCHGVCWIEYENLVAKPFKYHSENQFIEKWKMSSISRYSKSGRSENFLGDLGTEGRYDERGGCKLFRFSGAVQLELTKLLGKTRYLRSNRATPIRPFHEMLLGRTTSNQEWDDLCNEWEMQESMDSY